MADLSGETGIVVVKIGSSTLVDEAGAVDTAFIADLCHHGTAGLVQVCAVVELALVG